MGMMMLGVAMALTFEIRCFAEPSERRTLLWRSLRTILAMLSALIMLLMLAGQVTWPSPLVWAAGAFLAAALFLLALRASLRYKILLACLSLISLAALVFYWLLIQLPYATASFRSSWWQHPRPLDASAYASEWVSGFPLQSATQAAPLATHAAAIKVGHPKSSLEWESLAAIMQKDSRIRSVLVSLQQKQDTDLAQMLASMNETSVTSTRMRRNALRPEQVDALLHDSAISSSYHATLTETWQLLDSTERAFRDRQVNERLQVLLELLADPAVDETHRIELIHWLLHHLPGDIRLLRPFISLYDQLDSDYPLQKRLNRPFLELYLQKRAALLEGFRSLGASAIQPLLDDRHQHISTLTYSQARLDQFLRDEAGVVVHALYIPSEPAGIPGFLNRQKYDAVTFLRGPSLHEDSLRKSLLQMDAENQPPVAGDGIMHIDPARWQTISATVFAGLPDQIDRWMTDADPAVRGALVWALASRRDPHVVPLLLELVHDVHPEVRRLAAMVLGGFRIRDTQAANDPKFVDMVRLLQNYRANSDSYSRCWAVLGLISTADVHKTLYVLDLILNDGAPAEASLGLSSPVWRSEEEKQAVTGLQALLQQTPEEMLVKNAALKALMALHSPESLGILLYAMHHSYLKAGYDPGLWHILLPHHSPPQLAENTADILLWMSGTDHTGSVEWSRYLRAFNTQIQMSYDLIVAASISSF